MSGQQGGASSSAMASSHSKSSEHLHGPPFVCVPLPPLPQTLPGGFAQEVELCGMSVWAHAPSLP